MAPRNSSATTQAPLTTALTVRVYLGWFFTHCEAKNLSPETVRFYRYMLRYVDATFGDRLPDSITVHELRALVATLRKDRDWTIGTTNHLITAVKAFFNYLANEELIPSSPVRRLLKLKEELRHPDVLSREDVAALLATCDTQSFAGVRMRTMVLTLLDTGVRSHELLTLTTDKLDMATMSLQVFGKGRKERVVPFSQALAKQFVKYLPRRAQLTPPTVTALWVTREGTPLSEHYFRHLMQACGQQADIPHIHPHLFRHTFATEYLRNGGSALMLQRILGHTTQVMTQRYVHMTDTDAAANHRIASPLEGWHRHGVNLHGGRK